MRESAVEHLAIACGVAQIEYGGFHPPRVARTVQVDDQGNKTHFMEVGATLRMHVDTVARAERTRPDGAVEVVEIRPAVPQPGAWIALAMRNSDVADVLAILGREPLRWPDLYHVFEIVQKAVGSRITDDGWANRSALDRFKRTANSRAALGRDARHGHTRTPPPKRPMGEPEARNLVVGIARRWLESHLPEPAPRERVIEVRPPSTQESSANTTRRSSRAS